MRVIGTAIADVLRAPTDEAIAMRVRAIVRNLCAAHPLYDALHATHT